MAKILIVEDDPAITVALSKFLEQEGYTVCVAQESLQGTTMAHEEKPDLILLDLIMPLGGGKSTLRNLKVSVHTRSIPVIVISATDDTQLIADVKAMGVAAYLQKPFNVSELIDRIQQILSGEKKNEN